MDTSKPISRHRATLLVRMASFATAIGFTILFFSMLFRMFHHDLRPLLQTSANLTSWEVMSRLRLLSQAQSQLDTGRSKPGDVQETDWRRFAYVQYATDLAYLCNSVMLFARLEDMGCQGDRLLMYPNTWDLESGSEESRLLKQAREAYGAVLQPVQIQRHSWSDPTWAESYTKLLAVNQTQYDRVLSLDSDSTILQCLDELFLLPPAPFAMPRAYWVWSSHPELSDQILLSEPNSHELDRIMEQVRNADAHTFDMDIMNTLYLPHAMVLPHREYDLITGEFRKQKTSKEHLNYLGNEYEEWNGEDVLHRAKFLHFSDWPIPKPWLPIDQRTLEDKGPQCNGEDCTDKNLWMAFYGDFKRRRMDVCSFADWGGAIQNATLF